MQGKLLVLTLSSLSLGGRAWAQASPPGTIRLLSGNETLVDAASGDGWVELGDTRSGKFLIYGPARLQAELRVNLTADQTGGTDAFLDVMGGGKLLKRYRLSPRSGGGEVWKGRNDLKPSARIGFFVDIDPGPHAYELRISGAPRGAGLLLVPAEKARRPLAANAPVVPAKPPPQPVASPAPTGTAVAVATPPIIPGRPRPQTLDQIATTGRAPEAPLERYPGEVAFKGGIAFPVGGNAAGVFPAAGVTAVEARWALDAERTLALGLEISTVGFGALTPVDPARAVPPMAVNLQLVPAVVRLVWLPSGQSRFRPYLAAGPGLVYGISQAQTQANTFNESSLGPAAEALAGIELDLAPGEAREGTRKVFLEANGCWYGLDFAAHPYDAWTTAGVLAGVEIKF